MDWGLSYTILGGENPIEKIIIIILKRKKIFSRRCLGCFLYTVNIYVAISIFSLMNMIPISYIIWETDPNYIN